MRGLAACWVLLHHAAQSAGHFNAWNPDAPWVNLVHNGFLGVDFFFVLSGFIIAFASQRLLERGGRVKEYLQARLVRIYVPYLPVGIGMYLLYLVLPGMSEGGRSPGLLTSLLLVPSSSPAALSVAWTLVHELIFYLIFCLIFVSRRLLWSALALWTGAIALAWSMDLELGRAARYLLSPLNLCFMLGVLIHVAGTRIEAGLRWPLLLAVTGGGLVALQAWQSDPSRVWVAAGFGLLVLAAASTDPARRGPGRFLLILGAASYSIYLVHNPMLSIAARIAARLGLQPEVAFVAISIAALAAGLAYWALYERPALRVVRRWLAEAIARGVPVRP